MADIVDLHKPERLMWLCGHCGCTTFRLYNDSTSECAACGSVSDGGEWVTPLADMPKSPEKDNGNSINVIGIGTIDFARRGVLKKITDKIEDVAIVAAWFNDGSMTSWSGAETPSQRDWIIRKLRDLLEHFEAIPDDRYEADDASDH